MRVPDIGRGTSFPLATISLLLVAILLPGFDLHGTWSGHARAQVDDPLPIPMYFDNGTFGKLTPFPVEGEDLEHVEMVGNPPPVPPFLVGRWSTNDLSDPTSIYGPFTCILWAESQEGAKNAYFVVEIYRESTQIAEFNTTKMTLSSTPTRFEIRDSLNVEMRGGESLSVWVYFHADMIMEPGKIFPQPSQASFLFGGSTYDSGITVSTIPMRVEIVEPDVDPDMDFIGFKARVKECFNVEPKKLNATMTIKPPAEGEVDTLTEMEVKRTEEAIVYSVDWKYLKDKAKDGRYTISMEVSYDGNLTFSNTSSFEIDVPEKPVTDLSETPVDPVIVGLATIGIVLVGLAVYLNRKGFFKRGEKTKGKGKGKRSRSRKKSGGKKKGGKKKSGGNKKGVGKKKGGKKKSGGNKKGVGKKSGSK